MTTAARRSRRRCLPPSRSVSSGMRGVQPTHGSFLASASCRRALQAESRPACLPACGCLWVQARLADIVLRNDGTVAELHAAAEAALRRLRREAHAHVTRLLVTGSLRPAAGH